MSLQNFVRTTRRMLGAVLLFLGVSGAIWAQSLLVLPRAQIGQTYSYQIATSPPAATGSVYSVTSLPAGLTLNSSSGLISGNPTVAGTFAGTLTVTAASVANSVGYSLAVDPAGMPVITAPPAGQTVLVGQPVTFSVTATGSPTPGYQWKKDGVSISGATGAALPFAVVSAGDAGSYTVTVSNTVGSVISPAAALAVGAVQLNPLGTAGTSNWSVSTNQYVGSRFTVTAATKLAAAIGDFSNGSGTLFVAVVPLASLSAIPVGTSAVDVPFNAGEVLVSTLFTLPSSFSGRVTVPLSADLAPGVYGIVFGSGYLGATGSGSMLAYGSATGSNGLHRNGPSGGSFTWFNTSSTRWSIGLATVTGAGSAPGILVPPAATAVPLGGKAALSVVPTGMTPFAFAWMKDGSVIGGSTSSTLLLTNFSADQAGQYTVVISNAAGNATSAPAAVSVSTVASPVVNLTLPSGGPNIVVNTAQSLSAVAIPEAGRTIVAVTFFANGVAVGSTLNAAPYVTTWTPTAVGSYSITARALDNAGGNTLSAAYVYNVTASLPPTVSLTSPAGGASLPVNSAVTLGATAAASSGNTLAQVQFFANGLLLGTDTTAPYTATWTPTLNGTYTLTARAVDTLGTAADSAIVTVSVNTPLSFLSANAATFTVGTAGAFTVQTAGFPAPTYSIMAGTFPAWAALNATTGVVSGTPTSTAGAPFAFTLQAANGVGVAVTQSFVLSVAAIAAPPVFGSVPAPRQVVALGQNLDLGVTVTGAAPTTFQWKRNGFAIAGATGQSYGIVGAAPSRDNGWYQAVATNAAGSTTSPVIFVNVSVNPSQVAGWGYGYYGQAALQTALGGVSGVAAGAYHSLALKADGTVTGWGSNIFGETSVPSGLGGVVAVAGGNYFSLALKADGTVVAWGNNGDGQAAPPAGLSGVVAIAAGYSHALALKADGTVVAWGWNVYGQTAVPGGLGNAVAVSAGTYHSLALKADGTVTGWGYNGSGQTVPPGGLSGVVRLAAGGYHSLALKADGGVVAWGSGSSGQTTLPGGLTGVVSVSAGSSHSLALKSDGTVVGWGDNFYGQSALSAGLANVLDVVGGGSGTLVLRNPASDTALPSITAQPATQTAYVTGTANISVVLASNPAPAAFQWRKAGTPIFGATGPTYTIYGLQLSDAAVYDVVVTNGVGAVTSAAATLTVVTPPAPTITAPPAGAVLNAGNVGSFTVGVSSVVSPTYQWRKGGVALAGKNAPSYVLGPVQPADAGTYDVIVTNPGGSVTSAPATLVVHPFTAPVFTGQPAGGIIDVGNLAWFSATATGAVPMTYQWRRDGVAVPGATNLTLSIPNAQLGDAGVYDLVATNGLGSVPSAGATLLFTSMLTPPTVVQSPANQLTLVGVTATLAVTAGGVPAPAFQWRRNGVPLSGATAATLNIGLVQETDAGQYDVVVTNLKGSVVSAPATLTVQGRPVIWTARLALGTGDAVGTFVLEGPAPKKLLVRAIGPTLSSFSVSDALADPKIEIYDHAGQLVAANDDWPTHADQPGLAAATLSSGAFALAAGSKDAVVLRSFTPGAYVARVTPATPGGRIVLLELYDAEPGSATRVPYTAVRGSAASSGGEIAIGGLGANGSSQRTYLLRASGPALGTAGTLANPTFTVLRDSVVRASNDDWQAGPDTTGVAAAAARVGTFPLVAGSRDAALLVTAYVRSGLYVGQVAGAGGNSGLVLAEAIEADAGRPAAFAPVVVSPPSSRVTPAGVNLTLETRATGTEPVVYQWRKDGVTLSGATARALALTNVVPAHGGVYTVVASNAQGTATSLPAVLTVDPTVAVAAASQSVAPPSGYVAGGTVTINSTLTYPGAAAGLGWTVTLPPGWTYAAGSGTEGDVKPAVGATGTLEWSWSASPPSPVNFSYTLNVPAGETGARSLTATALVRTATAVQTVTATPYPLLVVPVALLHSADTNQNFSLSLFELTRVIELYNTRIGTTRTGCYAVATGVGSEDGFAPDATRTAGTLVTLARYHSADSDRDGRLSLIELTRVIELYNVRSGTTRTGAYHVQSGTEDGFAPGP